MTGPGPVSPGPADQPQRDPLLVRFAVSFYPRPWRERYRDEFCALLGDMTNGKPLPVRARLLGNAVRGGLGVRLILLAERGLPERRKEPVATVACAAIAFAVAVAGVAKMREGAAFDAAAHTHTAVAVSLGILRGAAALAGLAVVAGAAPLAWAVVRQLVVERRHGLMVPLASGTVAPLSWIGAVWITAQLAGRHPGAQPNLMAVAALAATGLGVVMTCAWAIITVIRRVHLPSRLLQAEIPAMTLLSVSAAAVTAADIAWGLALRSADAGLFYSDNGLISTPLAPNWAGSAMVLSAVTAAMAAATVRAARQHSGPAPI
jgi:hypothetical protein